VQSLKNANGGFGPKTRNRAAWARFARAVGNVSHLNGGLLWKVAGWCLQGNSGRGVVRSQTRDGVGAGGRIPETESQGFVSGAPLEMGVENGTGMWCGGADEAVVVVGWWVCESRGREGVGAKNSKPSRWGSISGAPLETLVLGCIRVAAGGGGLQYPLPW
jgi:hypothetical protein